LTAILERHGIGFCGKLWVVMVGPRNWCGIETLQLVWGGIRRLSAGLGRGQLGPGHLGYCALTLAAADTSTSEVQAAQGVGRQLELASISKLYWANSKRARLSFSVSLLVEQKIPKNIC